LLSSFYHVIFEQNAEIIACEIRTVQPGLFSEPGILRHMPAFENMHPGGFMPLEYEIDSVRRIVFVRAFGTLISNEIFNYQQKVWSQPEMAGYHEVVDMSDVSDLGPVSSEVLRYLAEMSAETDSTIGLSKLAIVAPTSVLYGLGRMFQAYREMNSNSKQIGVFRNREEAIAWISDQSVENS